MSIDKTRPMRSCTQKKYRKIVLIYLYLPECNLPETKTSREGCARSNIGSRSGQFSIYSCKIRLKLKVVFHLFLKLDFANASLMHWVLTKKSDQDISIISIVISTNKYYQSHSDYRTRSRKKGSRAQEGGSQEIGSRAHNKKSQPLIAKPIA